MTHVHSTHISESVLLFRYHNKCGTTCCFGTLSTSRLLAAFVCVLCGCFFMTSIGGDDGGGGRLAGIQPLGEPLAAVVTSEEVSVSQQAAPRKNAADCPRARQHACSLLLSTGIYLQPVSSSSSTRSSGQCGISCFSSSQILHF